MPSDRYRLRSLLFEVERAVFLAGTEADGPDARGALALVARAGDRTLPTAERILAAQRALLRLSRAADLARFGAQWRDAVSPLPLDSPYGGWDSADLESAARAALVLMEWETGWTAVEGERIRLINGRMPAEEVRHSAEAWWRRRLAEDP